MIAVKFRLASLSLFLAACNAGPAPSTMPSGTTGAIPGTTVSSLTTMSPTASATTQVIDIGFVFLLQDDDQLHLMGLDGAGSSVRLVSETLAPEPVQYCQRTNEAFFVARGSTGALGIHGIQLSDLTDRLISEESSTEYSDLQLSPDCQRLAFVSRSEDSSIIRILDVATGELILCIENAFAPTWLSPNGNEVAYIDYVVTSGAGRNIRIADSTDEPQALELPPDLNPHELVWNEAAREILIVADSDSTGESNVYSLSLNGGAVTQRTFGVSVYGPLALETRSRQLAFVSSNPPDGNRVYVLDLKDGLNREFELPLGAYTNPSWLNSGRQVVVDAFVDDAGGGLSKLLVIDAGTGVITQIWTADPDEGPASSLSERTGCWPGPNLSRRGQAEHIHPYRLRGLSIERPNPVGGVRLDLFPAARPACATK